MISKKESQSCALWLALVLVEPRFLKKVNYCLYYIIGHTKNAWDYWFSSAMKKIYRKSDTLIFDQHTHQRICFHAVNKEFFKNYLQFENWFYKIITNGEVFLGHIFSVDTG